MHYEKGAIYGIALAFTAIALIGCTRPATDPTARFANANEHNREIAAQIIEVVDEFLDGNASAAWTYFLIRDLRRTMDTPRDLLDRSVDAELYGGVANLWVRFRQMANDDTSESFNEMLSQRNFLAAGLGLAYR